MLVFPNGIVEWAEGGDSDMLLDELYPDGSCECGATPTILDNKGKYDDGRNVREGYEVIIDMDSVSADFDPKAIRITRDHHSPTPWLPVQRVEWYELTGSIIIWE